MVCRDSYNVDISNDCVGDLGKCSTAFVGEMMKFRQEESLDITTTQYSEAVIQQAAAEIQRDLLLGKGEQALQAATNAGLWGLALLVSSHTSQDSFKRVAGAMARAQFPIGSPLRTLYSTYLGSVDGI